VPDQLVGGGRILHRRFNAGAVLPGSGRQVRRRMRSYGTREKLKITAGAISALVIVAWLAVLAIAFLAA